MTLSVVFTPEAEEQLVNLYRYITRAASPETAGGYTDSIVTFCEEPQLSRIGAEHATTSDLGFESSASGDV